MEKVFKEAKKLLLSSEKILILLHKFPDGDTICSSLALATYLKRTGKKVDCAVKDVISEAFRFLPGTDDIKNDFLLGDYDLIMAVDCGDTNRTGFPTRLDTICKSKPLINIDHHLKNNLCKMARVNIIDTDASAAAEIVWDFLRFLKARVDSRIATYILAGIYYDTGGFYHSNVTGKTLKVASECLRLGGRIAFISRHISASKTPAALKLWGVALTRMEVSRQGIVSTFITYEDILSNGAEIEDTSGIVNLINTIPAARIAILFLELPDGKIRASVRTEEGIDVSKLARIFGGGGHKKAAGFTLEKGIIDLSKLHTKKSKWADGGIGIRA